MAGERVIMMGHLAERQLDAERLRLKICGLRDSMRIMLDSYIPCETIKADIIAQQAVELAAAIEVYREVLEIVAAIRADLGR